MLRPKLEIADIFRCHGQAWRSANPGHINRVQRRVMKAIEICRTAKLGGHVERCQDCEHTRVAYNSCLMGKFRNGELTDDHTGLIVDFEAFTLHYELASGRNAQLSGDQSASAPCVRTKGCDGWGTLFRCRFT